MSVQRMSLALLSLALILGLVVAKPQGRLLGSEDANVGEFPWAVSLRLNNVHICLATIISENHMLTAAHCISKLGAETVPVNQLSGRVGSLNQFAGGTLVQFSKAVIHPSYGNFMHDLAILTVKEPLTLNEKVNKIALPKPIEAGAVEEVPANGTPVYVAGWGEQLNGESNFRLQKANFNTLSKPNCELAAGYGYDSTMCITSAEKEGICRGDEGAAVINDEKELLGVASFFFGDCGSKYPDITTRTTFYLEWIEANTK